MKHKFLVAAGAALAAAAVSVFVYANSGNGTENDFFNANIEALAKEETDPDGYVLCFRNVSDSGAPGYYLKVRECWDCSIVTAERASGSSTCME